MPRGVVDLEGQPAHLQLVSLFQVPVHGWRRGALQTEPTRLLLQISIQELILLVQVDGDVPCLPHSLDAADVANVAEDPEVWETVVRKLRAGAMPPLFRQQSYDYLNRILQNAR